MMQKIMTMILVELPLLIETFMSLMIAFCYCEKDEKIWKAIMILCGFSGLMAMTVIGIGIMTE